MNDLAFAPYAVVVGDAAPLRYQSAGSLRQALRWAREELDAGAPAVAIKASDLALLLRKLAALGGTLPNGETVELSRHEVRFTRDHLALIETLERRLPSPYRRTLADEGATT